MALLRDTDFQEMLADENLSLRHARFTESKLDEVYEAFGRAATGAQYRIGAAPANPQFAKLRNSRLAPPRQPQRDRLGNHRASGPETVRDSARPD